ncbi:MAG: efflux RND transporter periplasmic adaptor subunit, partial [Candidatus Acidiferrales bacterium]
VNCVLRRRTSHAALAMCLLAGISLFAFSCSKEGASQQSSDPSQAITVGVAKVTRQDLSRSLQLAAEFEPYQEIEVYAKVSGYIKQLYINWGTHVKQGQLLAVLEIPELQQQLAQDQAAVERSVQDEARAKEGVSEAESAYNVAHITYTRLADVQKSRPGLVAQQEIDVAQGKDLEGSAGVSGAKDELASAEQGLLVAKATLQKDEALYSYARITAPFDGVITDLSAYTGALLPAGTSSNKGDQALCRLSQIGLLRLTIPVPEAAVPSVHVGMPTQVVVPSLSRTYQGKVARFSDRIDLATRTMYTEIDVPNPHLDLVPGMYAYATLDLQRKADVLTVPVQALNHQQSTVTVFRVDANNKIEQVAVTIGLQTATRAEVLSGLKENDLVVISPPALLRGGQTVSPKLLDLSTAQGES